MRKKRVYVETSVISDLTARPARDIIKLAKQHLTGLWWEQRERWELFVSPPVLEEIADGHPEAAAKRLEAARGMAVLDDHPKARALAKRLVAEVPIPEKAQADAAHLALAAFHGMDYLATWNQTHLDNPHLRSRIDQTIRKRGLTPALVLTPERLLEMDDD